MKILHIITSLDIGGAERQLAALVCATSTNGQDNVVVSLMDDGIYAAQMREAGAKVYCFNLKRGQIPIFALFRLAQVIRQVKPDLVQTWLYHADLAGILASLMAGRPPVIWSVRCSDMELHNHSFLTRQIVRVLGWLSSLPVAVVANSRAGGLVHRGLGYHPRMDRVIPNGIDTDVFAPNSSTRERIRRALGVKPNEILVGCVARHAPMKDHAGLLKAFARVRPEARLVLIGTDTGKEKPALSQEIAAASIDANRVIRLGPRRYIPRLLPALDLFVLGSAFGEGFPNALAEAMSCGLPVVATDTGDSAAIIGDCGKVVPPRSPGALATALNELIALNPQQRAALGCAARARVVEKFSLLPMVQTYQALYSEILETEMGQGRSVQS